MQSHPPHSPQPAADPSDPIDQAACARALLATTLRDPWRASLLARRIATLRERLDELRAWLASMPRRLRRAWARRWALALPASLLVLALAGGQAQANTITVDVGAGGNCSLFEAIENANDTVTGQPNTDCGDGDETGADTIRFANAGSTYALFSAYGVALPEITSEVTIQGNGNTTLDAEGMFSVLNVNLGSLALANATLTGGSTSAIGGGIRVYRGTLSVTSTTISGNSADDGGGVYAIYSTVTISDTTISDNSAIGGFGGGIASALNPRLTITGSTITRNSATEDGGGISSLDYDTTITNCTISGNSASNVGGGIRNLNLTLTLRHSTITGNSAGVSAGGISNTGQMYVGGSIVADQAAGVDCANDGTLVSNGYNLEGGTSCGFTMGSDIQTGTADLDPLADNGGPTFTHALGAASDAREAGDNAVCAAAPVSGIDQRGVTRPQPGGGTCDIGAFEAGAFTLTVALAGSGSGTVTSAPAGIACPGTCMAAPFDGIVNLTPVAAPGSVFAGWSGDCAGGGVAEVEVLDDRTCTATFDALPTPTPLPTAIPPTAAQVTHFAAAPDPTGRIRIAWQTASEVDVAGFRVERSSTAGGPWTAVGGLIPARGEAAGGARYAVTDSPGVGHFAYRLAVESAAGAPQRLGPIETVVRAMRAFLPIGWRGR